MSPQQVTRVDNERVRAFEWVATTRAAWREVLDALADESLDLSGLWRRADDDFAVSELKLLVALEARPGAKKVHTRRALDTLGVSHSITLGQLDDDLLAMIGAAFADPAAPSTDAVQPGSAPNNSASGAAGARTGEEAAKFSGVIVVISGPGGVGKGTVVERLLAEDDRLWLSRSWTTRARRDGEAAAAYRWATPEEFAAHAEAGGFLEWVEFLDYCQGSPMPAPPDGHDVIFEIDVAGAASIRDRWGDALSVFIDAPSRTEQEARLQGRGDSPDRIAQRLIKADEEVAAALELGCRVIINDDLDATVDELQRLIAEARAAKMPTA